MIKGNEELYSHIARPIPLLPRKSYIDDKARSHQGIVEGRKFKYQHESPEEVSLSKGTPSESILSSGTIDYLLESNSQSIVYRRDCQNFKVLGPNLLNLNKILSNLDKFSKPIDRNPTPRPYYSASFNDNTLIFESRFESGNLELAIKVSETEYNLVLQNDINSAGNTQWFFFKVSNTTKNLRVKFNLINLGKGDSLFNHGMKVLVFSEADEKSSEKGWTRGCEEILYHPNNICKPGTAKFFYSVTFTYTFLHSKDTVYFAYSYPYTYTDLMKYLLQLENDPTRNNYFSRKLLCNSIGGNRCDYLTITASDIPEYMKERKGVVISSRVHPGESVGSWMMHGVIDFLTGESPEANLIRENFVVKVVPMLNPDGVINGNYRTNLAGTDLNRKWKQPCKVLQPTIYNMKRFVKNFAKERKLELICDLHGHSRRMDTFMYGCNIEGNPSATRAFPLLISKLTGNFNYKSCSFHMQKSKESTLRISMFKEIEIPFVYTMEASFCGSQSGHYTPADLMDMGKQLCLALLINAACPGIPGEITLTRSEILEELKENQELLEDNNDTSGSDSEPSEDNLDQELLKPLLPKLIVRKKKSKKKKNGKKIIEKIKFSTNKRQSLPIRTERTSVSVDQKIEKFKKCSECGELDTAKHFCIRKAKNNLSPSPVLHKRQERSSPFLSSISPYMNVKGKKVRDQATQTMYIRKQAETEMKNTHSLSLISVSDRDKSPLKYHLERFVDAERLKNILRQDEIIMPQVRYPPVSRYVSPVKLSALR